jgi:hypothetical protein
MNTIDHNLTIMQLMLADIPAPFDNNDKCQRVHAHQCLTRVQALLYQTLVMIRSGSQFRKIGRPSIKCYRQS